MSDTKKRNTISYFIIAGLAVACAYFVYQNISLKHEINTLSLTKLEENDSETETAISYADSLLISGNYGQALDSYEQLSNAFGINVELKKTLSTRLLAMKSQIERPLKKDSADTLNNISSPLSEESANIKDYDSLSFALEKAQMQLSSVRKQMKENNFGKYITFKSSKGNRLHYVGGVKNKKANGFGIAILDSGSRYEGEWQNNMRHGQGTFYWIDGEHYEGAYKNDLRSGQGTYYWTNGEKYVGNWDNDRRNGKGTFYGKNGKVITSGIWKEDKLVEEDK